MSEPRPGHDRVPSGQSSPAENPGEAIAGRQYIAALTGLRGLAAFWVFLFHFPALHPDTRAGLTVSAAGRSLQASMDMGFAGVNLFFALSGFLLALPFAHAVHGRTPPPPLGNYFKRRLLRVFPAFYAQLAIILLLGAWFVTWRPLSGTELFAHLLMFFNIGPDPVDALVAVWWTLPVEFSFYLLLPFIAALMVPKRWVPLLIFGILLSLAYRAWVTFHFSDSVYRSFLAAVQLPGTLPLFLLGASGAILVIRVSASPYRVPGPGLANLLFISGVAGSTLWLSRTVLPNITGFWLGHWSMFASPLVLGICFTLMILGLYWGSRIGNRLCANPVVYFSGLVSYSLYLWHFPVMQQIQQAGGETYAQLHGLVRFLVCTAAVFAVSSISYLLFERPFFRLRGKRKPG